MDTPDTSGAESLIPQFIVEAADHLLRQAGQFDTADAGEDVAIDQVAVAALGVAVPFTSVGLKPVVAPLPDREILFFLHIVASFWQTNNITESEE